MRVSKLTISIAISLLALLLRINLSLNGPYEYDEPTYIASAVQFSKAIRMGNWDVILNPTKNPEHPPLYKLVYAAALLPVNPIANPGEIDAGRDLQSVPYYPKILALRLISVIFGTAAVFLLCLIHPLAGLFLAINTYAIKYTSVVYLEALPALAALLALLAAEKAIAGYQAQSPRKKAWLGWLIVSASALGVAAASKYIYALVGATILLEACLRLRKNKPAAFLGVLTWGGMSLLFFFILNPEIWSAPFARLAGAIQYYLHYAESQHVLEVSYPWWQPLYWLSFSIQQQTVEPIAFMVTQNNFLFEADLLIFLLAVLGAHTLFKKSRALALWLAMGLAFLLIWNTKWPQYILLILAPWCLSACYGMQWLWSKLRSIRLT